MVEIEQIEELDRAGLLAAAQANRAALVEAEARELVMAAHWADLYNAASDPDSTSRPGERVLPGMEKPRRLGADGTPEVWEFAAAELAAVLGISPMAAQNLIGDALDLRHRHPDSYTATTASIAGTTDGTGVRVWQARKVAHLTAAADLTREQARWVDAQVVGYYTTLPWGSFLDLVAAKIIEADPAAAAERAEAEAMRQFVLTGRSNEYGLKTLIAKARAGDVIYLVAMVNRIAAILAENGDTDPAHVRRATALGILANPTRALTLLQDAATRAATTDTDHGADDGADSGSTDGAGDGDPSAKRDEDPEQVGEADVHPAQNDADDPQPETHPCPTCAGHGTVTGDPAAFTRTPVVIDPSRLLPPATLYLHLHESSFTRDAHGVARFEGVGPITAAQAVAFLGHSHVTITPVIDVAHQAPVDGYETPTRLREALHLRSPSCIGPWSPNQSRTRDADHTIAYLPMNRGGPPGQTSLANTALLGRYPHRLKTHGRWRLKQPSPGVFLWRTPHGYYYLVDHHGTHPLDRAIGDAAWTGLTTTQATGVTLYPGGDPIIEYHGTQHAS